MKDDPIRDALRTLPGAKASPGFTERVMTRIDSGARTPSPWPARALWASAAVALLFAGSTAVVWHDGKVIDRRETPRESRIPRQERETVARRLEELRAEHNALKRELAAIRSLTAGSRPVLELGGTEHVELILDLTSLTTEDEPPQQRPVNHRP